jgi:hypothetical protein
MAVNVSDGEEMGKIDLADVDLSGEGDNVDLHAREVIMRAKISKERRVLNNWRGSCVRCAIARQARNRFRGSIYNHCPTSLQVVTVSPSQTI